MLTTWQSRLGAFEKDLGCAATSSFLGPSRTSIKSLDFITIQDLFSLQSFGLDGGFQQPRCGIRGMPGFPALAIRISQRTFLWFVV